MINIITTITSEQDNLDTIWKNVQNAGGQNKDSGSGENEGSSGGDGGTPQD